MSFQVPAGWSFGDAACGIRGDDGTRRDIALIVSDRPATAAGMFTTNQVCAAPVRLCAQRVAGGVVALAARPVASSGDALGAVADGEGAPAPLAAEVGALLFDLVGVARSLGVDPETALLARARSYRDEIDRHG